MKYLFLLIIWLLVYTFRFQNEANKYRSLPDQTKIKIIGRISQQPDLRDTDQIIYINQFSIKTGRYPEYYYGQSIQVIGNLEKQPINRFLNRFWLNYPSIKVLPEIYNSINQTSFRQRLFYFRGQIEQKINRFLPQPQSSLLTGIVLGVKSQLPSEFRQELRQSGTIHIVVASGYNLTVIAGILLVSLTKIVRRSWAIILAFIGIIIYCLLVGGQPPVVRAALMAALVFMAQLLGRPTNGLWFLFLTAGLMLLVSPLLIFDLSWQLSFMATLGILIIYPRLIRFKFFKIRFIGDNLAITLAAQLGCLLILWSKFGQLNLLSPLINALILPIIPLIMYLGLILIISSLFSGLLGQLIGYLVWLPLTYVIKMIELFS